MSRSCLLVRHNDLRSSGRVICSHVMSITFRLQLTVQKRASAGKASYVAENNILLNVERNIVELNGLGVHIAPKERL